MATSSAMGSEGRRTRDVDTWDPFAEPSVRGGSLLRMQHACIGGHLACPMAAIPAVMKLG